LPGRFYDLEDVEILVEPETVAPRAGRVGRVEDLPAACLVAPELVPSRVSVLAEEVRRAAGAVRV
jgi:hypothetical protein